MTITLPMGIDATPLFAQIARQGDVWARELDLTRKNAVIRKGELPGTPKLPPLGPNRTVLGQMVDIVA